MGRPLRQDTIESMNLMTEKDYVLSKQVGFNKYLVKDADKIICLSDKAENVNDLEYDVLNLYVNGQAKPVTKILRNLVHTADGVFAYKLETKEVDGKKETIVVFADANVSFTKSEEPTTVEVDEPKTNEPVKEEPKVEEPKVEEPTTEEPKEGEE